MRIIEDLGGPARAAERLERSVLLGPETGAVGLARTTLLAVHGRAR